MNDYWKEITPQVLEGQLNPAPRILGTVLKNFGAEIIIGHPAFKNDNTIGEQLKSGILGAVENFPGQKTAFVISDGTLNTSSQDRSTMEAALSAAQNTLSTLPDDQSGNILVTALPYEGYAGDHTPGKGSALKLIFEEMAFCDARLLILLDGDLRNDMGSWQKVYSRVEEEHKKERPGQQFFITAKYARHFVDASLTRFIVGPLTTLMGSCVPGGISGDIVLSAGAVNKERGRWSEARRKYGTDISTTFDNLADPDTTIYEVYLGAKLHDITDEAKLSVMPGEVIGAALERLLHYKEKVRGILESDDPLGQPVRWGADKTGISFIDPGYTDAFDIDVKINALTGRWADFSETVGKVYGQEERDRIGEKVKALALWHNNPEGEIRFLGVDFKRWIDLLGRAVAYALRTGDLESSKRALNYLYTAAFLEFCGERLKDLGLRTIEQVRQSQNHLGVPADQAEEFYRKRVDQAAFELAEGFYANRKAILEQL
jgi:hypothetical protein